MNRRQKVVLWIGAIAAALAILFPFVPGETYSVDLSPGTYLPLPRVAFIFAPVFKGKVPLTAPVPVVVVVGVFTAAAFVTNREKSP
jgi:hypothetical protein